MKIHLNYFAILREQRGVSRETVETDASTLEDLYAELRDRYAFTLGSRWIRAAVGDEFAAMSDRLSDGDTVTFIPPVAGG